MSKSKRDPVGKSFNLIIMTSVWIAFKYFSRSTCICNIKNSHLNSYYSCFLLIYLIKFLGFV
ncbi:hypothetical protein Hdeb2414_s0033g00719841 [Helianthus debilis subsp. tardiflorus]